MNHEFLHFDNSAVSSIVGVLLATATIYELLLIHRAKNALKNKRRAKDDIVTDSSSGIGCTTYDLTSSVPNKGDLPIGIVIPRGMNNNNSDENLAEGSINVEEIKLSKSTTKLRNHYNSVENIV